MLVIFEPESSSSSYYRFNTYSIVCYRMVCAPDQVRIIWCLDKGSHLFNDPSAVCRKPLSPGEIQECLLGAQARPKAAVTHLFVIPEPAAHLGPPTTAPPSLCSTNSKPGGPRPPPPRFPSLIVKSTQSQIKSHLHFHFLAT